MNKEIDEKASELLANEKGEKVIFLPGTVSGGGKASAVPKGRPPGSRFNRPTKEDLEYYTATEDERKNFIENDPVVRSASGKDPLAVLGALKTEVAKESAALHYQRVVNEKMGKDISQVSARRIDALKKIADIELEMRKIGFDQVDVRSEPFQRIFKLWVEMIRKAAEETLPPEYLDMFFNRLTTDMDNWEEKADGVAR